MCKDWRIRTSGVTVGPDKCTGAGVELVCVPDRLVEQRRQTDWETWRALAAVDVVRVGHVALVVGGSDVLAVPARWEEDLSADTVVAGRVQELLVRHEVAVTRALRLLVVTHAVEAKRLLAESHLVLVLGGPCRSWRVWDWASEVAQTRVTCKHLEFLGEGLEVVAQKEVVCEHTTDLRDDLGHAIFVNEVQRRCPEGIGQFLLEA
jgi:hypothetical protein